MKTMEDCAQPFAFACAALCRFKHGGAGFLRHPGALTASGHFS